MKKGRRKNCFVSLAETDLSVDDKRLKTVIVKGLRRIYYKKFYTLRREYLFL